MSSRACAAPVGGHRTPGIERFDYFRHVVRRREGSEPPEVLLGLQDRFDTRFLDSPVWQRARAAA